MRRDQAWRTSLELLLQQIAVQARYERGVDDRLVVLVTRQGDNALIREADCGCTADSARCAGDRCNFIFEFYSWFIFALV